VSGAVPFKAMLQNWRVDAYDMFWQVDGDRLNRMFTDLTDYPHKEVSVDLSGWNWKGSGPYLLNFIAKDLNGVVVAQKSSSISVQ
jgi:hypothetical protein